MKKDDLLLKLLWLLVFLGLLVAILLPSLATSPRTPRRVVDGIHLKEIAQACRVYASKHDDQFPPNLQALIIDSKWMSKTLISPLDKNPDPEGSYIYLGAGIKSEDAGQEAKKLILAYGKPELYQGKGVNVVYMNGHAEFVEMTRFEADLKYTKQWIKQYKAASKPADQSADHPEVIVTQPE